MSQSAFLASALDVECDSAADKLTLIAIANSVDQDGVSDISTERLMAFTRLSKRGVENAVFNLLQDGWMSTARTIGRNGKTIYRIELC